MNYINVVSIFFISNIILWPFKIKIYEFNLRLNLIVIFLIFLFLLYKNNNKIFKINTVLLMVLLVIALSIISLAGPCEDSHIKSILSLPMLLLLIASSFQISRSVSVDNWLSLEAASIFCIFISILTIFIEISVPEYFPAQYVYRLGGIHSGLFDEPSHLAFSLFPCFLTIAISTNPLIRMIGGVFLIILIYLSPSSTLLIESILIFFLMLIKNRSFFYFFVLVIGSSAIVFSGIIEQNILDLTNKITNIFSPSVNSNMSSQVYLQGWQDAYANLKLSNGFGIGFNMMGCHPLPTTEARSIMQNVYNLDRLNAQDGSFLLAKGISEFGVFFILFFLYCMFMLIRIYRFYNSSIGYTLKKVSGILGIIIFSALFTMSIRSSSYFTSNFPLIVLVLFTIYSSHLFNSKNQQSISSKFNE